MDSMYDSNLELQDSAAFTASAAGTVDSVAKIVNFGEGLVKGKMFVDVSALEIASNDEAYRICLQGSSESDFASTYEELAAVEVGAKEVINADQDSTTGRYVVPFTNERNGTIYSYGRLYLEAAGSIVTGITFSAWLGK